MEVKKIKVQCAVCGKIEYVNPCRARKYRTCSKECMGKYNRNKYSKKVKLICQHCGKEFLVKPSHADRRHYCSKECQYADLPTKFQGSGNPNYKGRLVNSDGYIKASNEKYTLHRETVKEILGVEELPKTLIVHHKDADKHSNNPKNLILLTHKLHTWLHKNVGNYILKAVSEGKIDKQKIINLAPNKEAKQRLEYIFNTNCTMQSVVLKQGELLGSPIYEVLDNQQPSSQSASK